MNKPSRIPAVLTYLLPVIGWLYVFFFQRKNVLAIYHLRQAVGLFLFLAGLTAGWGVLTWVLAWVPYLFILAVALFTLVIAAYLYGIVAWLMGLSNALSAKLTPLPLFGAWASRLPLGSI